MKCAGAWRGIAVLVPCLLLAGASIALDANTATQAELEAIRGIGPALASRIVEARRAGPFADLDDLGARVRGVGDAKLRTMREAGLGVGASGRVQTFTGRPDRDGPKRRSPAGPAEPSRAATRR